MMQETTCNDPSLDVVSKHGSRRTTCYALGAMAILMASIPTTFVVGQERQTPQNQAEPTHLGVAAKEESSSDASVEQEKQTQQEDRDELAALRKKVDTLEERVATLERLLLSRIIDAAPADREQLQAELQLARDRLDHTKRLFDKGYVSKLELMSAEYGVERAELRLELATMAADQAEFAASMQLFEAQANLDLALQRLETSSHLAARGFITQTQLRSDQIDADRARQMVDAIRARLQQKSEGDADEAPDKSDQE